MNETEELFQNIMRDVERKIEFDMSFRKMFDAACADGLGALRVHVAPDGLLQLAPINLNSQGHVPVGNAEEEIAT